MHDLTCTIINHSILINPPIRILSNPYNPEELMCPEVSFSINVDGNSIWHTPPSNKIHTITIESGASLTINDWNVKFDPNGIINVKPGGKLILSNTTLEGCDGGAAWYGINLDLNAELEIKNNSKIKNARSGILYGQALSFPNSNLVTIQNLEIESGTQFIDCVIGIGLYSGNYSNVNLDGIVFDDGFYGIVLDRWCWGLNIANSSFNNQQVNAIKSTDSYINIKGNNQFVGSETAIEMLGTSPIVSGINLGRKDLPFNTFIHNDNCIISSGIEHPAGSTIVNNKFENNVDYIFYSTGSSDFNFNNNSIDQSHFGIGILHSGDNENDVNCNSLEDVGNTSMFFKGENSESEFLENHFQGFHSANIGLIDADIKPSIGTANNPAMNCFETSIGDAIFVNGASGANSTYYYFNGPTNNCIHQPNSVIGITNIQSQIPGDNCDQFIGIFGLIDPDDDGELGILPDFTYNDVCGPCIQDSIDTWINTVVLSGGDNPTTLPIESGGYNDPNLEDYQEVLDEWINFGIYYGMATNDLSYSEQLLLQLETYRWKKRLYGIYLLQGKINQAEIVLNTLPNTTNEEISFISTQIINLKTYNFNYNLITSNDINTLRTIATSDIPASGYAKSLLDYLTDEKIDLYYPPQNSSTRSSIADVQILNKSFVNPNPAQNYFTIKYDAQVNNFTELIIYDIRGNQMIKKENIKNGEKIDISKLSNGIYIISLVDQNGIIESEKLIIGE